jgi:oligopeptidase B
MNEVIARKIDHELVKHGDKRNDPYFWMNQRDHQDVLDHLEKENAYTTERMKPVEQLQGQLFEEIVGRIPKDDVSVPYRLRDYWYYVRYEKEGEYPIYCRKRDVLDAEEEILLNVNEMAVGSSYYQVSGLSISEDQQHLSFGVDDTGRRIYQIRIKDLRTGEIMNDRIDNTTGSGVWSNDDRYLFYTIKDETLRPHKIMRHKIGTDIREDVLLFEEKDESFVSFCYKTKSRSFIIIGCSSTVSNEYHMLPSGDPMGEFKCFQPRERGHEYGIAHFEDHFYVRTNLNGATNFKLMRCPLNRTTSEHWQEVIPHREDVLLEGIDLFDRFLVREERFNGLSRIIIRPFDGEEYEVSFDEETYSCWIGQNPEFESDILRFGYTSMTVPSSVFDFNMDTRERDLKKQQKVVGGYDQGEYESKRIWARSHDGEKVAISLVYKKSTFRKGANPCLLYGYGSYGHTIDPYFSSVRLSLLDRGFVFAIAHIRGGEYLGRKWYEDGRQLKKKNTFYDFIACGQNLIDSSFCKADGLYAMGGSAGGLLMGAVLNMAPQLFKGVVSSVPFVDVVSTMLDDTIPLTTGEYDEWGDPNKEEFYHYIKEYSPYDNVEAKAYPAIFVNTGYHDSQVQYWEPAKWVAKLRDVRTNKAPLIFHCDMDSGHSGPSGRFSVHRDTAMEYAFLIGLEKSELV